jgi:hypothetical protein
MAICLVSTFCLFRTRYVRYFIVLWCMLFMDFFNEGISIYIYAFKFFKAICMNGSSNSCGYDLGSQLPSFCLDLL